MHSYGSTCGHHNANPVSGSTKPQNTTHTDGSLQECTHKGNHKVRGVRERAEEILDD